MLVRLFVVRGKANKGAVVIRLPAVIGRSRDADLTIVHPMISRRHCQLFESEGLVKVRDLGSLNGTYLGGEQIQEAFLPPGSVLTIGPLVFRVEYEVSPAAISREPSVVDSHPAAPSDEMLVMEESHTVGSDSRQTGGFPTPVQAGVSGGSAEPATEPLPSHFPETPVVIHESADGREPLEGGIAPPDGAMPDARAWQQVIQGDGDHSEESSEEAASGEKTERNCSINTHGPYQGETRQGDQKPKGEKTPWADAPPPFTVVQKPADNASSPILLDSGADTTDDSSRRGGPAGSVFQSLGRLSSSQNVSSHTAQGARPRGWWFFGR
ncbi:MAG: FHA domain-containing protein [Thermogutta sp.]